MVLANLFLCIFSEVYTMCEINNDKLVVLPPCIFVERSGSGVELRTLDNENPGSNPGCGVKTLGKFVHSTLLQFTQLNKMSTWP